MEIYLVTVELLPFLIIEFDIEGFYVAGGSEVDKRVADVALILSGVNNEEEWVVVLWSLLEGRRDQIFQHGSYSASSPAYSYCTCSGYS